MARRRKRGLTIGKVRSALYFTAKLLGDVSAVRRGPKAIWERILRRIAGRIAGKILGKIR